MQTPMLPHSAAAQEPSLGGLRNARTSGQAASWRSRSAALSASSARSPQDARPRNGVGGSQQLTPSSESSSVGMLRSPQSESSSVGMLRSEPGSASKEEPLICGEVSEEEQSPCLPPPCDRVCCLERFDRVPCSIASGSRSVEMLQSPASLGDHRSVMAASTPSATVTSYLPPSGEGNA